MWLIITVIALGLILGGILLLQKSAKKFNLTPKELERIKRRNTALEIENDEKNK